MVRWAGAAVLAQRLTGGRARGIILITVGLLRMCAGCRDLALAQAGAVKGIGYALMDFREMIIRYRDEKGLSQQELADLLQVTRQTVSRWESGKSRPQPGQIAGICAALHVDARALDDLPADAQPGAERATARGEAGAASEEERADPPDALPPGAEPWFLASKRGRLAALIVLGIFLLAAVVGLVLTIIYAVKDSLYDASATVWIIAIPQNTPMLVLCVFLAVFIVMLAAVFIYLLLRGKKK